MSRKLIESGLVKEPIEVVVKKSLIMRQLSLLMFAHGTCDLSKESITKVKDILASTSTFGNS